jgi:hypothetical protein
MSYVAEATFVTEARIGRAGSEVVRPAGDFQHATVGWS